MVQYLIREGAETGCTDEFGRFVSLFELIWPSYSKIDILTLLFEYNNDTISTIFIKYLC